MAWMLLIVAGVIVLATVLAWLLGTDPLAPGDWSGRANQALGPWRTLLMLLRWTLWALLWWRWDQVGLWLFRGRSEVVAAQRQQWTKMRTRMMAGIAVVEVIMLFSTARGQ